MAGAAERALPASLLSWQPVDEAASIEGAFERLWSKHSSAFCALAEGEPAVTRRCADPQKPMRSLRFADEYVRLCAKTASVDAPNAMHALLLCAEGGESGTRTFVTLNQDGLRPARIEAEADLDLHLLCVTVLRLELNACVTLFGPLGRAGVPISPPNSWLCQLQPAVWPLTEHLCESFYVVPCSSQSWLPREPALVPFAAQEAQLAAELYCRQFDVDGRAASDIRHVEAVDVLSTAASEQAASDADLSLLASLELPLLGARATLATAYAAVAARDPEHPAARLLLQASAPGHAGSVPTPLAAGAAPSGAALASASTRPSAGARRACAS